MAVALFQLNLFEGENLIGEDIYWGEGFQKLMRMPPNWLILPQKSSIFQLQGGWGYPCPPDGAPEK